MVGVELLSIDSESCLDAARAGGKAARLAAAKRAHLPVLPGLVVPVGADDGLVATAAADVENRGHHAARLAVMESTTPDLAALSEQARELGDDLVVRSSSPDEDRPDRSGAYTSYIGITPSELPTAVRGVWASALVDDSAAEQAASPRMAVLIQRCLRPSVAGTAQATDGDSVQVTVVRGSSAPLLAGWIHGDDAVVDGAGAARGSAVEVAGSTVLAEVAALTRRVSAELGDDLIEWAATDAGEVFLLQSKRAAPRAAVAHRVDEPSLPPAATAVARLVHAYAGSAGEELILPLLLTGVPRCVDVPIAPPRALASQVTPSALLDAWSTAQTTALSLQRTAWDGRGHGDRGATAALADLRSGEVARALDRMSDVPAPDRAVTVALLNSMATVAAWAVQQRLIRAEDDLWAMTPGEIGALVTDPTRDGAGQRAEARRRALLRWEPFVYSAIMGTGTVVRGEPVSNGTGAGIALVLRSLPTEVVHHARMVVVAPRPIPQLAPLLWGAAGLVTTGGSASAHLVEVARSRGVPTVLGCAAETLFRLLEAGHGPRLVAVDGDTGRVAVEAAG